MGQGLAPAIGQFPLCCAQEPSTDNAPVVKATPSLRSVTEQSRNLQDPSWEVRVEAADFFGGLGGDSVVLVVPMLQELLLKDESWRVRQHAANAIQDLGSEAVAMAAPALRKVTQEDEHYTVRLAAAVALRKHGHKAEAAKPLSQFSDFGAHIAPSTASRASTQGSSSTPTPMMSTTTTSTSYSMEMETPHNAYQDDYGSEPDHHNTPPVSGSSEPWMNMITDEPQQQLADISNISVLSAPDPAPKEIFIVIERGTSGRWGMDVDFVVSGTCLRVSRVKEGAIDDWNQDHPEASINVGDLVVEMNGVSGDSKELVKIFSKADRLEMVVQKTGVPIMQTELDL